MNDFLQELNPGQREAVLYNEGPSLVIAGAGSGKTKVLTYKIAYLLKSGISPYNILALTFTNKAAREMKDRIAEVVGEDTARRLWMGTFHSIFSRILRREAEYLGFNRDFTVYDASDSKNLVKTILKEMSLDDKIYKPSSVQARISKMKNALITPEDYASDKELVQEDINSKKTAFREVYSAYWSRCKISGVMDFDDLLLYTYLLFEKFPDVSLKYRNQFRFVLVDEYQDTNAVQHEIVRLLAADHHRVAVVGDDAQSIYSFRGANIDNILNFKNTYPESKLFKLEQNYRSTQTIVNAANSLIAKNKNRIHKDVYSRNPEGEQIQLIPTYSDYEEGYAVAARISEMRMLHRYNHADFVILYRTNAQSRIFEEALRKRNIPYRIYGGLSFYQRKEIKDVISYFRMVTNPHDEEALKRVINYPARGIGNTTLNKISGAASAHGVSLWTVILDPLAYNLQINAGTGKKISGFKDMINDFLEKNKLMNAYEIGDHIIRSANLVSELYKDKTPEGLSRIQNIEELVNSLYTFVSTRREEDIEGITLSDFLAEISLMTDQDMEKGESDVVTMMTIHSAKGLEFKNVFVVGLEEDLFPSSMTKNDPRQIEEERRLFYVAITRAEDNCVLSYAKSRFYNGQSRMQSPSRFLNDIDVAFLNIPKDAFLPGFREEKRSRWGDPEEEKPMKKPWENEFRQKETPKITRIKTNTELSASVSRIGDLHIGSKIMHERFGAGEVVFLEGAKENAKATVVFESFGKKQLLLKFAKFTIL